MAICVINVAIIAVFGLLQVADADHFAVIVAGSNGYYNYRHQADVCHAYQILHKNGIPDENIVVMMYDDIAHNRRNPTPGIIINKPGGEDVYHGVPKDYIGKDVTPENFLNVLRGNKSAMNGIGSGKVINSGPEDYVFVNFADHGAPNLIAFPHSELHAQDLINTINYMNATNRYKKMVFYVEACESGSMFNRHKLNRNINVFATTAANGRESSYACYYDKKRHTYLGDVYSVKWMEDSDKGVPTETLQKQFEIVKSETNTSHAQEFGDLSMGTLPIKEFQGENMFKETNEYTGPDTIITDAVPSPDVPLMILYNRLKEAKTSLEKKEILIEIQLEEESRMKVKSTVYKIAETLIPHRRILKKVIDTPAEPRKEECYKHTVSSFRNHCFDFNKFEHALRHVYVFANLCDEGFEEEKIHRVIKQVCVPKRDDFIQVMDAE